MVPTCLDPHPLLEIIELLSAYKNSSIHHSMEWIKENVEKKLHIKAIRRKLKECSNP